MLQSIRDRAQGVLAWIILVLISIPFVLWGVQNYFSSGGERPVASVGDREFLQRDLARAYEDIRARLPVEQTVDDTILRRQAMDNLVREEVMFQAADRSGIKIGDEAIRDLIWVLPAFQDESTRFNREQYNRYLASEGLSSQQFTERVRRGLAVEQYQRAILDSAFMTDDSLEWFFRQQNQKRKIEYFSIPLVSGESKFEKDEIKKYYQENQGQFENPEMVSIEYIELNLDEMAKKVDVKEEDLKTFYEEQKDYYTKEERRKISHILIEIPNDADEPAVAAARIKVEQLQERLKKGEAFSNVAKEASDDKLTAKNGGDLGFIDKGVMVKSFEEAAFALTKDEVSQPVKTKYGVHLIVVTEIELAKVKSFKEVQEELQQNYRRNAVENTFYQAGETLAESSYENPDTLKPVAEQLGLTIKSVSSITREKGENIAADPKIREAVFSDEVLEGNNSTPVELTAERIVVLRSTAHQLATVKPLAEVQEDIVKRLRNESASQLTLEKASTLVSELRKGKSIFELAKQAGSKLKKPEPFQRSGNAVSPAIAQAVFKAVKPEKGKLTSIKVDLVDGGQAVVALLEVLEGDPKKVEASLRESADQFLTQTEGKLEFDALIAGMREKIGVVEGVVAEQ